MPKGFRNVSGIRNNMAHTVKNTINKVNSDNTPPDSGKAKVLVKLIFASLALISVIFFIVSGADLSPSAIVQGIKDKKVLAQADGEGYPVEIEGSRTVDIDNVSNGTAVLTDSNYMVLNNRGQVVVSDAHYMASPVMKTAERYTLLYDESSKSYMLRTLSGSVVSGKTDYSIVTGALSRSGKFALVTYHDTAFSNVSVYSKSGRVLHQWKSSNYYITDVAINPSGSHIAMCCVTVDNGEMKSSIIIQKVGGMENLREYSFNNTLMMSVSFVGSDTVSAIGDNLCAYLGVGSEKKTEFNYDGSTLNGFDSCENGSVALVLSQYSDSKNCRVVVLDKNCRVDAEVSTQLTAPSVELTSDRINLVNQSQFYSYGLDGRLVEQIEIPADSQESLTVNGRAMIRGVTVISEAK